MRGVKEICSEAADKRYTKPRSKTVDPGKAAMVEWPIVPLKVTVVEICKIVTKSITC